MPAQNNDKFRREGKLTLKIEKFSVFAREKPHAERKSVTEQIQGIEWHISAEKAESEPECMGVYLNCAPESQKKSVWSCEATFDFTILARIEEQQDSGAAAHVIEQQQVSTDTKGRKRPRNTNFTYKTVKVSHTLHCIFRDKVGGWGISGFIKLEELLHPENGSYDTETDAIIIEANVKAKLPYGVKLNRLKQMYTFEKNKSLELYESGDFSDWTIKFVDPKNGANSKEFKVHKYVLATHSDVFRAMFTNTDTREYKESRVVISDCSQAAIRQMILFMYTMKLPADFVKEDAGELLKIADKYHIEHLAVTTEKHLIKDLTVENAFDFLALADRHNANSLRVACSKMIRKNLKTVKEHDKWSAMRKHSPQLLLDVFEDISEDVDTDFQDSDFSDDSD